MGRQAQGHTRLNYAVQEIALVNGDTALVKGMYRLDGFKILSIDKSPEGPLYSATKAWRALDDLQGGNS